MPINDILREQAGVPVNGQQRARQGEQSSGHNPEALLAEMRRNGATRQNGSLGPVVAFEKTDIQFWMDVATLVVLILILLRL